MGNIYLFCALDIWISFSCSLLIIILSINSLLYTSLNTSFYFLIHTSSRNHNLKYSNDLMQINVIHLQKTHWLNRYPKPSSIWLLFQLYFLRDVIRSFTFIVQNWGIKIASQLVFLIRKPHISLLGLCDGPILLYQTYSQIYNFT